MAEYPHGKDKISPQWEKYPKFPNRDGISGGNYSKLPKIATPPIKPVKISAFEEDVNDIAFELVQLLLQKHKDYGPKNINQSPYGAIQGLVVRMWDKIARIVNLTSRGRHAENEPLEDSFKDLANYAIIGLMVQRGKWPTE
jgi:hypothetical protein